MPKYNLRNANSEDAKRIVDWSVYNGQKNNFDANVLLYPSTQTICVEEGPMPIFNETSQILYVPLQLVGMFESLAPSPAASNHVLTKALYVASSAIMNAMREIGVREVYFLGSDPKLNAWAEKKGFEKLKCPVYRRKL